MNKRNFVGSKLYLSAGLAATNDAAGFATVTFTKACTMRATPPISSQRATIANPDLCNGIETETTGMKKYEQLAVPFTNNWTDAAQLIAQTAYNANAPLSMKLEYPLFSNETTPNTVYAEIMVQKLSISDGGSGNDTDIRSTVFLIQKEPVLVNAT